MRIVRTGIVRNQVENVEAPIDTFRVEYRLLAQSDRSIMLRAFVQPRHRPVSYVSNVRTLNCLERYSHGISYFAC